MAIGNWGINEEKALFNEVEEAKKQGKALKSAFLRHAQKYGRAKNSVRNYYYHALDRLLEKDNAKELGIDLSKHKKNKIQYFSQEEGKEVTNKIKELVHSGNSVRKACILLANGDASKMLRFQNKYRNTMAKTKKENEENVIKFQKKESKITGKKQESEIIKFQKSPNLLSDSEIQALFMGIVRIVKKNELKKIELMQKQERNKANENYRKMLVSLGEKDEKYLSLKEKYQKLKEDYEKIKLKFLEKEALNLRKP